MRFSGIPPDAPAPVSDDETIDIAVNTVFRANTSDALLQALEAGMGIGGMQLPLAARALQTGTLVQVLPRVAVTRPLSMRFIRTLALFHTGSEALWGYRTATA